jgi:hypothetical protein
MKQDPMYDYPEAHKVLPAWRFANTHAGQPVSNMMEQ